MLDNSVAKIVTVNNLVNAVEQLQVDVKKRITVKLVTVDY